MFGALSLFIFPSLLSSFELHLLFSSFGSRFLLFVHRANFNIALSKLSKMTILRILLILTDPIFNFSSLGALALHFYGLSIFQSWSFCFSWRFIFVVPFFLPHLAFCYVYFRVVAFALVQRFFFFGNFLKVIPSNFAIFPLEAHLLLKQQIYQLKFLSKVELLIKSQIIHGVKFEHHNLIPFLWA